MRELTMAVPPADGSEVLVAVDRGDVPDDLVLASPDPGKVAARAAATLEQLLEKSLRRVHAVSEWVRARSPDDGGVEFRAEAGRVMVADSSESLTPTTQLHNGAS